MRTILLILCLWSTGHAQVREKLLHSNKRDTVMLESMTVKEFKNKLSILETGYVKNPYKKVNTYGYLGKYQISKYYLKRFGKVDKKTFLESRWLQEKTMNRLCLYYLSEIDRFGLSQYKNTCISGIVVTLEGLMAGYHQHPVALIRWLRSNGKIDLEDGNGCRVSTFVKHYEQI